MKLPLTLILLGAALPAAAQTATPAHATPAIHGRALETMGAASPAPLWLASDDDDEDGWLSFGDDDSSGDDCDDDEGGRAGAGGCKTGGVGNAAPAGTVAPPANGLFGDGKAPKASTN